MWSYFLQCAATAAAVAVVALFSLLQMLRRFCGSWTCSICVAQHVRALHVHVHVQILLLFRFSRRHVNRQRSHCFSSNCVLRKRIFIVYWKWIHANCSFWNDATRYGRSACRWWFFFNVPRHSCDLQSFIMICDNQLTAVIELKQWWADPLALTFYKLIFIRMINQIILQSFVESWMRVSILQNDDSIIALFYAWNSEITVAFGAFNFENRSIETESHASYHNERRTMFDFGSNFGSVGRAASAHRTMLPNLDLELVIMRHAHCPLSTTFPYQFEIIACGIALFGYM